MEVLERPQKETTTTRAVQHDRLKLARQKTVIFGLTFAATAAFIYALIQKEAHWQGLPWYITLAGLALVPLARQDSAVDSSLKKILPSTEEPISFSETYAMSYLALALAVLYASFSHYTDTVKPVRFTQVVDIQLITPKDFEDQNSLLPSTKPQEEVRKRLADTKTIQGTLAAKPQVQTPVSRTSPPEPQVTERPPEKAQLTGKTSTPANGDDLKEEKPRPEPAPAQLVMPSSWSTVSFARSPGKTTMKVAQTAPSSDSYMQEVAPPEMVELVENDGDSEALSIFQRGGRSAGGQGADSNLASYLKRLHKKIKLAWNPPRGICRKVELTFRLSRSGTLESATVSQSSGQFDTDSSTIAAVSKATNKPEALPQDFPAAHLDIVYTFKYNVDELQEIEDQKPDLATNQNTDNVQKIAVPRSGSRTLVAGKSGASPR